MKYYQNDFKIFLEFYCKICYMWLEEDEDVKSGNYDVNDDDDTYNPIISLSFMNSLEIPGGRG